MCKQADCQNFKTSIFHSYILSFSLALGLFNIVGAHDSRAAQVVNSPDGNVVVTFDFKNVAGLESCMVYSISYKDRPIVIDSQLGLAIKDAPALQVGFDIVKVSRVSADNVWSPVYGERKTICDHYNELIVELQESQGPYRRLKLTLRVYNEGVAFCYTLPQQNALKSFIIEAEQTQFRFTGDHSLYAVYSAQGRYSKVRLSELKNNCERPLTLEVDGGPYVSIAEARLVDYARTRLSPDKRQPYTLVSSLDSEVRATTPYTTPWRVLLFGDDPGELLERNYLILNLNEPCAIKDTSWIKPGKVIREVTLTTTGGRACVDFAVEHNLQYVEFDAGWYGHEYSDGADATTVSVDPKRSKGPLNLHEVIDYAKKPNVGIILYVNRRALERQLDEVLPLYEKWGVKGVKFGFVQVGSQRWTRWLHQAVRKAAKHHLMVDIHDEYRPTGYSRTYPNLMTQEGIRGNECMPSADENLILPFTRMLAGAADYTICYYHNRIKTTHAHQLAASVVYYSPWQFLFWYDTPSKYQGEPEIEFFEHLPTVWADTKVINAEIGKYITIARKSGQEWYVGTMNGFNNRKLNVPLTFLEKDKQCVAHIYSDAGPEDNSRTHVRIERYLVDSSVTLTADLPLSGGQAIRIAPASLEDTRKYKRYPMPLGLESTMCFGQSTRKQLRDIIGVTHVSGKYHLTNKDFLNEGADQILELGSRVIKVWFHKPQESYPFNSQWPQMNSMVEIARSPYFRKLFNKPFTTYIMMCFSVGRWEAYWRKGITKQQELDEQRQFYELAKHLLTEYKGTGKTFILQHWEGDWLIRAGFNRAIDLEPVAIRSMIEWLNARQTGVNQARQEIGQRGAKVYNAAEVNRVVASMKQGRPGLVNEVLPHTNLDLVSYSAWDAATEQFEDPNVFRQALDFIAANMPDSPDFGNKNVYIGEFGMPENKFSAEQIQEAIPNAVQTALNWGCPYIVYWQLYCNELDDPKHKAPVRSNDAVRGFWLIRPDGSKAWTWEYFQRLLNPSSQKM